MKGNVIRLNIMHLNSVHLNSIGEVQSVSLTAGESTEDPVYPPTTYTLAANVSNGKVTATKNGTAIPLPYVATEGDVIVLSVTPDEGYEFNGWLDGNNSNPRTVTMTGNVVLSASCVEIAKPTYTLSASVTNGMVSAKRNGSAVNLPFTANEGDVIILSVTPNDGYAFEGWNDGNTDNPRSITMNADVTLSAECVAVVVKDYIQFADAEVERVLIANGVSSDGVGITMEDAAKVTNIASWFNGNTAIESFDELDYFTGVTSISSNAFNGCANLQKLIFRYAIPPTLGASAFANTSFPIYVPDASLEAYKTATNWNTYADRIHPLSEIEGGHITTFEGLIGAYTFEGRSNEDADRDIVEDKSGYNNTLTLKSMQWGFIDSAHPDLVREGLWDEALWLSRSGYGEITLPNGLTDFTIIAKRFAFNANAGREWSPLVGTGKSSGKGLFWLEYNAGKGQYTNQVNGLNYTLPSLESEITWMTNAHYNGHRLTGTQGNDVHDGMVYINRFRGDVSTTKFQKIYAVYLFNRQLSPSEIEAFIKEKIDASYVLPTIEQ